jgi:hypothetical protein
MEAFFSRKKIFNSENGFQQNGAGGQCDQTFCEKIAQFCQKTPNLTN